MTASRVGGLPTLSARRRPRPADLQNAWGRQVPDVIGPDLRVLFVGINPGLWSGAVAHHFAHPSSRFWKALYLSGFTPRLLAPEDEEELLRYGLGLTNLVDYATAAAKDLTADDLRSGARLVVTKVRQYRPVWVCLLGVGAYRIAFEQPRAQIGLQPTRIVNASVWVLPGPSGQNAQFPITAAVAECTRFKMAVEAEQARRAADPASS